MTLLEEFRQHVATLRLEGVTALVAVSGGPDSVALLDLLVQSRDVHGLALIVAHVDHGIHAESSQVAEDVRALAVHYGLPFEGGHLGLGAAASETIARAERYAWLGTAGRRLGADFIMTAHHADDQVETVLMRVIRGSGPAGLAGIAPCRGPIVRPLLPFRRAALAEHLTAAGLSGWLDPANADARHLRSWLRTELLPVIRRRIPDLDANLSRLAMHAAQDRAAWNTVLDRMPVLAFRSEVDGVSMAAESLLAAGTSLAQALLLTAARRAGCQLGPRRLSRVMELLRTGASGLVVPLGGGWRAGLSFGRLYLIGPQVSGGGPPWLLQGDNDEGWWGRWRFRWRRDPAPARQEREGNTAWFTPGALVVRRWLPGERLRPLAGAGRRLVAHCLQEARIPRWRRADWPVVTESEHIVWVPGVCRSDALLPEPAAAALRVDAEYI